MGGWVIVMIHKAVLNALARFISVYGWRGDSTAN